MSGCIIMSSPQSRHTVPRFNLPSFKSLATWLKVGVHAECYVVLAAAKAFATVIDCPARDPFLAVRAPHRVFRPGVLWH